VPGSLAEVRDAWWRECLDNPEPGWFGERLGLLLAATGGTPLRSLFPYTSVNSLQFSRCSEFPWTYDCPWIWFTPDRFIAYPPHPSLDRPGNTNFPLPEPLIDTDDPRAAVDAAVAALLPTWREVWLGSTDTPPAERR